jgi:hypothetical protein
VSEVEREINVLAGERVLIPSAVVMPKNSEEALQFLARFFPMIGWHDLTLYRLKTNLGVELLALPAPVMEQLLAQVVELCVVMSHDGPAQ